MAWYEEHPSRPHSPAADCTGHKVIGNTLSGGLLGFSAQSFLSWPLSIQPVILTTIVTALKSLDLLQGYNTAQRLAAPIVLARKVYFTQGPENMCGKYCHFVPTIAEEAGETSSGVWCHWGQVPLLGRWWLMGRGRGRGGWKLLSFYKQQVWPAPSTQQSAPTVRYWDWSGVLSST